MLFWQVTLGKPSIAVVGTPAPSAAPAADEPGTVRNFRVLYLDDIFRVALFEPEDEEREPVLFVFQRLSEEEEVRRWLGLPRGDEWGRDCGAAAAVQRVTLQR